MASNATFLRASPACVGVDIEAIDAFLEAVREQGIELHSFLGYRRGAVFAEAFWTPYRADRPHMLHSLSKSITATGVGIALDEKRLSLDDRVVAFFGHEELPPEVGELLGAMTVRHLLMMATGHATGLSGGEWRLIATSWAKEFFKEPVVEPPGTRFIYSSASSYMLSAIVQRATGQTMHAYMSPRFFEPLGMRSLQWDLCPNGVSTGGNGISCTSEDLLRLAVVYLQRGLWNGRRLLSEEWIATASAAHFRNVSLGAFDGRRYRPQQDATGPKAHVREGYGYHWWIGPGNSYYAAGLFGQYAMVLPDQEAALVFTSAIPSEHHRLPALAWKHLIPGMSHSASSKTPTDQVAQSARWPGLTLLPSVLTAASPRAAEVSGRSFTFDANEDSVETVSFTFNETECLFQMTDARGTHRVAVGLTAPIESDTTIPGRALHHAYDPASLRVVAIGQWDAPDVFRMTWVFVETPFRDEVVCRFDGRFLWIDRSVNVNSSATHRPTLRGTSCCAQTQSAPR